MKQAILVILFSTILPISHGSAYSDVKRKPNDHCVTREADMIGGPRNATLMCSQTFSCRNGYEYTILYAVRNDGDSDRTFYAGFCRSEDFANNFK